MIFGRSLSDAYPRNTERSENIYKRRNLKWTIIILDYGGLMEIKTKNRNGEVKASKRKNLRWRTI